MKTQNQWNILRWSLEELSNKDLQEQLWLGKIEGQMSTFVECICRVFDDSGLARAIEAETLEKGFTKEMKKLAEKLSSLISKIPQTGDDSNVLKNSRIDEVRNVAATFLALLPPPTDLN